MPFYTVQRTPAPAESPALISAAYHHSEPFEPQDDPWPESGEQDVSQDNDPPPYDSPTNTTSVFPPQSILLDRCLVFPSQPPSNALYQLNHDLGSGHSTTIGRIDHSITLSHGRTARTRIKDRVIYTFSHRLFNDTVIEVAGKRRDGFTFVLIVKSSSMRGSGWKVCASSASTRHQGAMILHCKPVSTWFNHSDTTFKWVDAGGKTIAVENKPNSRPKSSKDRKEEHTGFDINQSLDILEPLEQKALDLLVTSWCARVWHDNTQANKVPLTPHEGKFQYFSSYVSFSILNRSAFRRAALFRESINS
jgi:hypothetical protein